MGGENPGWLWGLSEPGTGSQRGSLGPAQTMQFGCRTKSFSGRDIENLGHVVSTDAWRLVPQGTWSLHTKAKK